MEKHHDELIAGLALTVQQPKQSAAAASPSQPAAAATTLPLAIISAATTVHATAPPHDTFSPPFDYIYPPPPVSHAHRDSFIYGPHDIGSSFHAYSQPLSHHARPPLSIAVGALILADTIIDDNGPNRGPGPPGDCPWLSCAGFRLRKLKMPICDDINAFGWVYRAERYFDIQGFVTSGEKLRAAILCMEGQALSWYCWAEGRTLFRQRVLSINSLTLD